MQGKVWGITSSLFNKNNVEINMITCDKGGFCSKHKHTSKYNMFFIIKGSLEIDIWKNNYELVDKTILKEQQSCIVEPGEFHVFRCREEGTIALEIYWVEISRDDIERETVGGIENQLPPSKRKGFLKRVSKND